MAVGNAKAGNTTTKMRDRGSRGRKRATGEVEGSITMGGSAMGNAVVHVAVNVARKAAEMLEIGTKALQYDLHNFHRYTKLNEACHQGAPKSDRRHLSLRANRILNEYQILVSNIMCEG